MFGKKSILAFIGARAGSKGLRHKNTRSFAGKPLLCWTIDAARGSKYIDRTLVSTDGARIAKVAKAAGADVPFMRPAALATDSASILHAICHATDWLAQNEGRSYDYVIMLQPTSPLRSAKHIDQAIEHYFNNRKTERDTLVSVTIAPKSVAWLLEKNTADYIDLCFPLTAQNCGGKRPPDITSLTALFFGAVRACENAVVLYSAYAAFRNARKCFS